MLYPNAGSGTKLGFVNGVIWPTGKCTGLIRNRTTRYSFVVADFVPDDQDIDVRTGTKFRLDVSTREREVGFPVASYKMMS